MPVPFARKLLKKEEGYSEKYVKTKILFITGSNTEHSPEVSSTLLFWLWWPQVMGQFQSP